MVCYRVCEALTEAIIYLMVIFGPWAFGTTQTWSIQTMNAAGYLLGIVWMLKRYLAWTYGFRPPRWAANRSDESRNRTPAGPTAHALYGPVGISAVLSTLILLYCLISAINARATFDRLLGTFDYRDCLRWLPHSFDSNSTWFAFWMYLGLGSGLWSIRDWLLGRTNEEQFAEYQATSGISTAPHDPCGTIAFPTRLSRLLTLLAFNGGVLAAESLIQRLADSPKLLFIVKPQIHQTAITQLGPYAYRANAAEYLNLLWPVCLGFWCLTGRAKGVQQRLRPCLLICVVLMAVASMLSASKGGALVCLVLFFFSAVFLLWRYRDRLGVFGPCGVGPLMLFFVAPILGFALGGKELVRRLPEASQSIANRQRIYRVACQMIKDFGFFGSGPGTYETVSELYRPDTGFWPTQVHNDWLETRITFGLPGSLLIVSSLAALMLRCVVSRRARAVDNFVFLSWLGLGGCLLHALVDFPFQVHSILFLFVLICLTLGIVSQPRFEARPC